MNRILAILCSTILLISFIGCQKQDSDILLTAVSQLDTAQHTEQLHEYDSPYTLSLIHIFFAIGVKIICLALGAAGIANMWVAVFADVGVTVIAVLNAIRALYVKKL